MVSDAVSMDGSPVEAYAALPAEPDLGGVRGHLVGRGRVLDLGCGAGRIADPLSMDGLDVVAVDESEPILRHVRHAHVLRSSIENLDIGRTFDAVRLWPLKVSRSTMAAPSLAWRGGKQLNA